MANHQTSTHAFPAQVKVPRLTPRKEHLQALQGFTEFTDTTVRQLLDEALEDFIQCTLLARAQVLMERAAKVERAAKKAKKKVEQDKQIADYLTKLEGDLN